MTRVAREKKPRPNVWANEHCQKYKPNEEGYGRPDQWVKSFRVRMGLDEANEIIGTDDPLIILSLTLRFTPIELKKAYRREVLKWHPDRHQGEKEKKTAEVQFKRVQAAYVKLRG